MATTPKNQGPAPQPAEQQPQPQQSTPPPAAPQAGEAPLTLKAAILAAVDATIAKDLAGARRGWSQKIHCRCIARVAINLGLDPTKAKEFVALLGEFGLGGNASQFRQWLEKPAAKDGPGRLDPESKVEALVADF